MHKRHAELVQKLELELAEAHVAFDTERARAQREAASLQAALENATSLLAAERFAAERLVAERLDAEGRRTLAATPASPAAAPSAAPSASPAQGMRTLGGLLSKMPAASAVRAAQESAAAAQGEAAALETALMLAQLNLEREAQSREALETARDEAVAAVAQAARTEAALRAELGAARAELETTRDELGRALETTRDELGAARAELETTRDELGAALEMSHAQLAAELVTSDQAARGAMALLSQAEAELQQVHAHAAAQVAASSQDGARQLEVIGARVEALALAMDGIATAAERLQVQIGNAERAEAQGRRRLIEEAVEAARTQLEEALGVATAEAQALDAEAAAVLKVERARGRIEAGLLAVDLACEERVVASQFTAAEARARAADSRDVVTRETFGLEVRALERRAATARTHAARALQGVRDKSAEASGAVAAAEEAQRERRVAEADAAAATSREEALKARLASMIDELSAAKAAASAASAAAQRAEGQAAEMAARRASGWEDELRLARARWEAERGREDGATLERQQQAHERLLEDREDEWAAALAAERADHRDALARERERLQSLLEEEVRRRQEAEDVVDSTIAQQRALGRGWGAPVLTSRSTQTTRSALHEEEESAAVASEASKARAKAVAAAALEARAAAEAAAEVRVREVTAAHAAALSEVRQQLDLAEQELAEERRCRRAIEQAAKQGAHEAMTEQARWRAAAAEGWLTAGREAKRRQAAQLARMSDMLQLGGSGGPLTERINGAEQPEAHGLGVESADGAGGGRAGLGAAWASPRASSPRASSPVPPAAEPDEAPWRESELIALQMLSGGSPSTTAAAYAPAAAAAGRSSLLSKHAIASPMGPARHAKPPARAATPKTRAAGAPPAPPAHVADGRAVSFGGVPLSSSLRPPRVRYEDTVAADLD